MKLINTILNMITPTASQNAAMNSINSMTAANQYNGPLGQQTAVKNPTKSTNKQIFSGRIEVMQVANGYVINIATREGYEMDTYVASTIAEVNERIAASMVSFQLGKK